MRGSVPVLTSRRISHSYTLRALQCNNIIRLVTNVSGARIISTFAGSQRPVGGFNGDGMPATLAWLNFPGGVAVDTAGNVFIGDQASVRLFL